MASDRVSGNGYPEERNPGIRVGRSEGAEAGTTETEPARVTRRCTECGRRGHYRTSPVYHPVQS
jgi:hypothetical protein